MSYILANKAYHEKNQGMKRFREVLGDIIQENQLGDYALIVPTGRRKRALERALIRDMFHRYKKPTEQLHCYTLESFVIHIFHIIYSEEDYSVITDAYRLLLFEKAASESALSFFSGKHDKLSVHTIEKCAELLYGLRRDGIDSTTLFAEIKQALLDPDNNSAHGITDTNRLHDLALMLSCYESYMGKSIVDYPAVLQLVIRKLEQHPELCQQFGTILLDGFSEFRVPEIQFLSSFAQSATPCACFLEYSSDNQPMFGNLNETFALLQDAGFISSIIADPFQSSQSALFAHLREWLFNTKQSQVFEGSENLITVLESTTINNEVDSIAKYIKWKHEKEHIPLHDMVIAMRNPEDYSGIFRDLLPLHGIPVNITDRPKLTSSPVITAIFSLLNLLIHNYQKNDIQRIFSSAYIIFPETSDNDRKTLSNDFELIARQERLKGGAHYHQGIQYWIFQMERIIKKHTQNLSLYSLQLDEDTRKVSDIQKSLASALRLQQAFHTLKKHIPSAKSYYTPKEFLEFVLTLLDTFGIKASIEQLPSIQHKVIDEFMYLSIKEEIERDVRALKSFLDTIQEFAYILEKVNTKSECTVQEYCKRLQTSIRGAKYQVKEKPGTGITVTSLEQIREIDYSVIIICGMVDGRFPLRYTADTFMGRELRDSEERHIRRERMQFYLSLIHHAPVDIPKTYVFSYPTITKDGVHLIRSQFLDALLKVTVADESTCTVGPSKNIIGISDFLEAQTSSAELLSYITSQQNITNEKHQELQHIMQISSLKWSAAGISERLSHPIHGFSGTLIPDDKVFSVTELDEYIECGYKYFANRLLKLPSEEREINWLSSLERGNLYHSIFYRFYSTLQQQYSNPDIAKVQLIPAKMNEYKQLLRSIASEELQSVYYDHPFIELEKRAMLGDDLLSIKGTLDRWLEGECEANNEGFYPALFEIGFSKNHEKHGGIPPIKITDHLTLQGKIDRIDVTLDNSHFRIIDYKTGSTSITKKSVDMGIKLQMPLYIKAAQQIVQQKFDIEHVEPVNPHYYFLTTFKNEKSFSDKNYSDETIEGILQKTDEKILEMKGYNFPVTPIDTKICKYCNFSSICRIHTAPPLVTEYLEDEDGN